MRPAITAAILLLACATPALAQTAQSALGAAEGRRAFFGLDMRGHVEGSNEQWRECVNPSGKTVYWFEGQKRDGTLRIRQDGALCFSYPDPSIGDEDCFLAFKQGRGNWRFVYEFEGGDTFVTDQTRKVKACPIVEEPIA